MTDLVPDALVIWPSATGSPTGVIVDANHQRSTVRFEGDPKARFTAHRWH